MSEQPDVVRAWHAMVQSRDPELLDGLLADDVVFRSPAVFKPQQGKALTTLYLTGAISVLGPTLRYTAQWHDRSSAVLEFEAELDGIYLQGVDMLRWDDDGRLTSITVMVRPLRGLRKLVELMAGLVAENSAGQSALAPVPVSRAQRVREVARDLPRLAAETGVYVRVRVHQVPLHVLDHLRVGLTDEHLDAALGHRLVTALQRGELVRRGVLLGARAQRQRHVEPLRQRIVLHVPHDDQVGTHHELVDRAGVGRLDRRGMPGVLRAGGERRRRSGRHDRGGHGGHRYRFLHIPPSPGY
jgi:hypothetical protein